MNIDGLEPTAQTDGIVLNVQAHPGAKKNEIKGVQNGALKVSVTQAPEKGKANRVLAELLAKSLGLKKSQVSLLSGETSGKKRFLFREISADDLLERLAHLPD